MILENTYGKYARYLVIDDMKCDAQIVVSLPSILPRVKYLELKVYKGPAIVAYPTVNLNKSILKAVINKWKDIESIVDYSHQSHILTHLPEAAICENLTSIAIEIGDYTVGRNQKLL